MFPWQNESFGLAQMKMACKGKCCKSFISEFYYSKLCLFHHDWKAFTYTPWLPYKWKFQAIYLTYRWIIALYFLAWLITSGVFSENGRRYLVFLTNWGIITLNIYLLVAALSTTTKYLLVHFINRQGDYDLSRKSRYHFEKPSGCCGYASNKLSWYQSVQWLLFTIANEIAFAIMILYWSLLYRGEKVDGVNINTHLMNGVIAVVDLWVSGVPINLLHVIYPVSYGLTYSLFTGIYFAITEDVIYDPILDYGDNLGGAIGTTIGVAFIFLPFVHIVVFYLQHFSKFWILHRFFNCNQVSTSTEPQNPIQALGVASGRESESVEPLQISV